MLSKAPSLQDTSVSLEAGDPLDGGGGLNEAPSHSAGSNQATQPHINPNNDTSQRSIPSRNLVSMAIRDAGGMALQNASRTLHTAKQSMDQAEETRNASVMNSATPPSDAALMQALMMKMSGESIFRISQEMKGNRDSYIKTIVHSIVPLVGDEATTIMVVRLLRRFIRRGSVKDARLFEEWFRLENPPYVRRSYFSLFDVRPETDIAPSSPPMLDLNIPVVESSTLLELMVDLVDRYPKPLEAATAVLKFIQNALKPDSSGSVISMENQFHIVLTGRPQDDAMKKVAFRATQSRVDVLRQWGESYGRLFGKYRINSKMGWHRSSTSVVVFATQLNVKGPKIESTSSTGVRTYASEDHVALKFMLDRDYFEREIRTRQSMLNMLSAENDDDVETQMKRYIVRIRESYTGDAGIDGTLLEKLDVTYRSDFESEILKFQSLIYLACSNQSNQRAQPLHVVVMDCGMDGDLHEIVRRGKLEHDDAVEIACGIAHCLKFMNKRCGVIHGDVKARNFVVVDKRVAAIDFDNAASIHQGEAVGRKRTSSGYLPPEQARLEMLKRSPESKDDLKCCLEDMQKEQKRLNSVMISTPEESDEYNDAEERLSVIFQDIVQLKKKLKEVDKPLQSLSAYPEYDMWCYGVMLYNLCTGSRLFNHNEREEVRDEELERIVKWSDRNLEQKLDHVPTGWGVFRTLLRKLLQPDIANRPASWDVILYDLDPSGTIANRLNFLEVKMDQNAEAVKEFMQQMTNEIENLMLEQRNVICPYVFQIITQDDFEVFKEKGREKVQASSSREEDGATDFVIESLGQAESFIGKTRSTLDLVTSGELLGTIKTKAKGITDRFTGRKGESFYLQLLCGRTFKPVVSYKIDMTTYSEHIVRWAKVGAKLCAYAVKVGLILNLGAEVGRILGSPVPTVSPESIARVKEFQDRLENLGVDLPLADLYEQAEKGFNIKELRDFGDFIGALEERGRMRQMDDEFEKDNLKGKSWEKAFALGITKDKHITYVSTAETKRLSREIQK